MLQVSLECLTSVVFLCESVVLCFSAPPACIMYCFFPSPCVSGQANLNGCKNVVKVIRKYLVLLLYHQRTTNWSKCACELYGGVGAMTKKQESLVASTIPIKILSVLLTQQNR
jgi:hypothetical protein